MTRYGGTQLEVLLGKRIRELRTARKWTAVRLSHETGGAVSRVTIAKLETGHQNNLSLAQGAAIAKAFGVTVESLLDLAIPDGALAVAAEIAAARTHLISLLASGQPGERC